MKSSYLILIVLKQLGGYSGGPVLLVGTCLYIESD